MRRQKGYLLIEVLMATLLLSVVGVGLYTGLMQGVKANQRVRETNTLYDPLKILWMKAAKDLRNTISLRNYKFTGKQDEMVFPSSGVILVRYFTKDGSLWRSEEALPEKFIKERPLQKILFKNVEKFRLEYAYLDAEERLVFKPIWMEEPYFGIPRAVKIEIKLKDHEKTFSRLISIPQGRWGHV